jgi:N-acetylglucosaminyldiphosphoundecaprenol N-acetyl-beta-D-mannosaminyltransferase
MQKNNIERIDIFGTKFSNINIDEAFLLIKNYNFSIPNYICFPSTNTIAKAYKFKEFQSILNSGFLTIPDGKFTEIYARLKGFNKIRTISGYWLMDKLLQTNLSHFFYGADNYTLEELKKVILIKYPKANVLGYLSPPYLSLEEIYPNEIIIEQIKYINSLKPDLIWIGISTVKQDFLMSRYLKYLNHGLMLGVGAVFLYMAGIINKGPEWIKKLGLRWIIRLIQEPKRLWKSTVPSLLFFIKLATKEFLYKIFKIKYFKT